MTLRDQILARIGETPHRAPTHLSIVQSLYPQARACIDAEIRAMLADRVIDTEQGDSGLTYKRAKASIVARSLHAPLPISQAAYCGLAFFPSKSVNAQPVWHGYNANTSSERETISACAIPKAQSKRELAAQAKAEKAASMERLGAAAAKRKKAKEERGRKQREAWAKLKGKREAKSALARLARKGRKAVRTHLTKPMSCAMFAAVAGIERKSAASMLCYAQKMGEIECLNGAPKVYHIAGQNLEGAQAEAKAIKRSTAMLQMGYQPALIAQEYAAGATVKDIATRWGANAASVRECICMSGGRMRNKARIKQLESAK